MDDDQDTGHPQQLTKGELALCAAMILAGLLITGMAVSLLIWDRRARSVVGEAEAMTGKAASERLGG